MIGFDEAPTIQDVTIAGNTLQSGGAAIDCGAGRPLIRRCTIRDNASELDWSGILCRTGSAPVIVDCQISDNAVNGQAIYCAGGAATIRDCVIRDNSGAHGVRIFRGPRVVLQRCVVRNNGGFGIWTQQNDTLIQSRFGYDTWLCLRKKKPRR